KKQEQWKITLMNSVFSTLGGNPGEQEPCTNPPSACYVDTQGRSIEIITSLDTQLKEKEQYFYERGQSIKFRNAVSMCAQAVSGLKGK
ncbi:hypothetical protein BaRGS_00014741, partial [Batillaria attramentaria]